jgi:hypothetical protein
MSKVIKFVSILPTKHRRIAMEYWTKTMWIEIRRVRLPFRVAMAFVFLLSPILGIAAPPAGGGAGAGGAAGGGAGASVGTPSGATGAAPSSPSAFFAQSSINFSRPSAGWLNWSFELSIPPGERTHNYYLCYTIEQTSDATVPFVLRNVDRFPSEHGTDASKQIPCHSIIPARNARPILRGDRLRVAIDMESDAAKAFFQNVSILNLNVVLTVAPPIQVTLLRTNLGATPTAAGLGGNQAPESSNYSQSDYQCFFQILGLVSVAPGERECTGAEKVKLNSSGELVKVSDSPKELLILPWPYTFPGDVIPTVYISALYTTPDNGSFWRPDTLYPAGSVVQCPGEDRCVVPEMNSSTGVVSILGVSGSKQDEPKWPGPNVVLDQNRILHQSVIWTPLTTVNYRVNDEDKEHAPDHKPIYKVGDSIVWTSGQTQIQSTVEEWIPQHAYSANSVILCPPDRAGSITAYESLCAAKTQGISGEDRPRSWSDPWVMDGQLPWKYVTTDTSPAPQHREGDTVVLIDGRDSAEFKVESWRPNHRFLANSVILCPPNAPNNQKLCIATNTGTSGANPPSSWSESKVSDGQVTWLNDTASSTQRWKPDTLYETGDIVRCEQSAQKANFCAASVGGYSGTVEPLWAAQSASPSASGGGPSSATYQRDNQVLWTAATPTATTAAPSSDQVVNLGAQELTQVHAPDLWGLSTAVLYTTKKIPNSYAFTQAVSAGCPTMTPAMPATPAIPATSTTPAIPGKPAMPAKTTSCPDAVPSNQRATDIALMISPYIFHHLYSKFHDTADGIDTESKWTASKPEDWIPEPIAGFGLNSIGNSFYVGLSMEIFVRNLQLVGGYGWIKAPNLTNPITASGSNTVTPNTYMSFKRAPFIGLAFNISGLISGH